MSNPDSTKVHSVKIFPPIGIARLGNSGFDLHTGLPDKTSTIDYFIPSEIPGVEDVPAELGGKFRDSKGRIKRQAARFRVYAYDQAGTNLGEITHAENYELTWTVHVANAKGSFHEFRGIYKAAPDPELLRNPDVHPLSVHPHSSIQPDDDPYDKRTELIVNPDEAHISGIDKNAVDLTGDFQGSREHGAGVKVGLGQLRTDDKGRLVFIPAPGYSQSVADPTKHRPDIMNEFDSVDWVDDTCDGWVNVKVEFKAAQAKNWVPKEKATIISAPPKFAWGVTAPTSLYDLIENIYWVKEEKPSPQTEFYQHIWPVLRGSYVLSWVNRTAAAGHGPMGQGNFLPFEDKLKDPANSSQLFELVFKRLRKPHYQDATQANSTFMPRLSGNSGDAIEPGNPVPASYRGPLIERFAALTELQYERFKEWHEGKFSSDPAPWDQYSDFGNVPKDLQPLFLTRAALEHTIGEPLYPGIETYWVAKEESTYKISGASHGSQDTSKDPPFRINHDKIKPGHLGRGLSLPWQSDFDLCNTHWWPSIRPDDVFKKDDWGTQNKISEEFFSKNLDKKHIKWDRMLRSTPEYPTEFYPGSTDMVRFWQRLGFVSKHKDYAVQKGKLDMPVWLQEEELRHPTAAEYEGFLI